LRNRSTRKSQLRSCRVILFKYYAVVMLVWELLASGERFD
jgi:hypothetical protein